MSDQEREWAWDVEGSFNPRYDATATEQGLSYGCEIQGPFCGWDPRGKQSWDEFLAAGPPEELQMPAAIAAEIRAHGLARKPVG